MKSVCRIRFLKSPIPPWKWNSWPPKGVLQKHSWGLCIDFIYFTKHEFKRNVNLLTEVHVPYYTLKLQLGLSFRSCCYVLLCRQCWTCSSCACWVKRTYLHKRVWPGRGHDSNSAWYLFRIPMVHRFMTSHPVRPRTSLPRAGKSNLTATVSFRRWIAFNLLRFFSCFSYRLRQICVLLPHFIS